MQKESSPKLASWRPFLSVSRLTPASVSGDLMAGITLAAIAIPEQMATARLGGFAPQLGLVAFVAGSLGFAAFGSSRQLSAGADSTITPIFAGGLAALAATGAAAYGPSAALLAIMVGLLLVMAGLLRLGWMGDLLSKPVLTGFLAGIALHIVLSQAPAVLGLPEGQGDIYQRLESLSAQARAIRLAPLAIGLGVFAVTLLFEKLNPRLPGALIALVAATILTGVFKLESHGVAVLGHVAVSTPMLDFPPASLDQILRLFSLAVVIALVVMVQTAATSRAFPPDNGDPDVNRDYLGVGAAGLLAGLAGAFPVNASPPRTAVVFQAGGQSQLCSLAAAGLVAALALFGAGLIGGAPTAALAGVLLFVAQRIFRLEVFVGLIGPSPAEFGLAALTALLIFLLPIQTGVAIGVFLSLAHGVFTTTRTKLIAFEHMPGGTIWWPASPSRSGELLPGVMVMGFQAPLSFLNAYAFRRAVLNALAGAPGARLFVLEAGSMVELDYTASEVLLEVIEDARKTGVDFAVARLESVRAQAAFDRFGITAQLGPDHIFQSVDSAVRALAPPRQAPAP